MWHNLSLSGCDLSATMKAPQSFETEGIVQHTECSFTGCHLFDVTDLPPGSWVLKQGFPPKEHSGIFRNVALELGNKRLIFVPNTFSVLVEIDGILSFLYPDGKHLPYLSEKHITIPKNLGEELLFDYSYVTGTKENPILMLPTGTMVDLNSSRMLENGKLGLSVMQFPKLNKSRCSYTWVNGDVTAIRYADGTDGTDTKANQDWKDLMGSVNMTATPKRKKHMFKDDMVLRETLLLAPGKHDEFLKLPSGAVLKNMELTSPLDGKLLFEMLAGKCAFHYCFRITF